MSAGFLAMPGIIPFGPLPVTAGLGGVDETATVEEPVLFQEGVGTRVGGQAFAKARAPRFVITVKEDEEG